MSRRKPNNRPGGSIIELWLDRLVNFMKPSKKIRHSDHGLFDPYVPIGSLQPLKENPAEWSEGFIADEETELPQKDNHFMIFRVLVGLLLVVIVYRLVVLQIDQGQKNYQLAEGNRLRTELVAADRGLIYDRNGNPLVKNVPNFSLVLQPNELPTTEADRVAAINQISKALAIPADTITAQIKQDKTQAELTLKKGISQNDVLTLKLRLNNVAGVYFITTPIRQYSATVPDLGHILGYVGQASADDIKQNPNLRDTSITGKSGIEQQYDAQLQGEPGIETLEVDSLGQTVRSIGTTPSVAGSSLFLGLDQTLQTVAANALTQSITVNGAKSGAVVAMDVNTGDILSAVSIPTYDNNVFSDPSKAAQVQQLLNDPGAPLLDRVIAGQYPSGSTIKPIYAVGALDDHVIAANTTLDTSAGKITVGGSSFSDWTTHGVTDVKLAIAQSNDIFFYALGGGYKNIGGLGVSGLDKWLKNFGFGSPTGIDLPGEAAGLVPDPAWYRKTYGSDWYLGNTYNLSIGQGDLLITPLQLTRATAAIANGGKLLQPRIVKSVLDSATNVATDQPVTIVNNQVATASSIQTVRDGMRETVTQGSARQYFNSLPFPVAAKTGTAQITSSLTNTHSWFTCFAPYDNPQIAISVIVEGGGEGWSVAAPVAKNILEQYFHIPLSTITKAPPGD